MGQTMDATLSCNGQSTILKKIGVILSYSGAIKEVEKHNSDFAVYVKACNLSIIFDKNSAQGKNFRLQT